MKLTLISCDAQRPDKRAIANCIMEIASDMSSTLAQEFSTYLLEGDAIDIEVEDKKTSSAFRSLRKLSIDYEIVE